MKAFSSLFAKLSIGLAALLLLVGLLYVFLSGLAAQRYVEHLSQDLHRSLADNLVADKNLVQQGRLNQDALKETFRQYMVVNPSIEIYLLDLQGGLIAYSADPGKVKREKVSLRPIFAFLDGSEQYPLGDDPRSHDKKKPFSVTTVPSADQPEGYLYVVLRGEQFDEIEKMAHDNYFRRLSGWAVAASLLVGLLTGLAVFYWLTRRLRGLSQQMEHFEHTDTPPQALLNDHSGDEIDHINRTFKRMAQRIRLQLDQLEDKDIQRRQLVAQVSHDLRTPLASMLGYIESLELKHDRLSVEQQQSFLAIAHKQGKRLSRMIESLFELSSLEARETEPLHETFMPAEWLHDVAQKHRIRAEAQGVTIEVDIQHANLLAEADLSLLERVMDNLIDNALSHANDAQSLSLSLADDGEQVAIAVTDQGQGIDPQQLATLFEPFARGDTQNNERHHAGLGLAIAKRIMLLLGGDIRIESQLGKGSVFTLLLPKATK